MSIHVFQILRNTPGQSNFLLIQIIPLFRHILAPGHLNIAAKGSPQLNPEINFGVYFGLTLKKMRRLGVYFGTNQD